MSVDEERATSFGSVAGSYDQVRPGPAGAAVDWLVPGECAVAVDLAAGTGLFTRAIAGRVPEVIAVEPDARMRGVLASRSPGVRVLAGTAEALPLPDASVDAVFVSTAWHWFDPVPAVREIARVLRDGGRLGVLWTSRDRADDWVAELDVLRAPGEPRTLASVREQLARHHTVTLPADAPFGEAESGSFGYEKTMTVDGILDWVATNSGVIMAGPAGQAEYRARCREVLLARADGAGLVEMPVRSWCWRATRLARPPLGG